MEHMTNTTNKTLEFSNGDIMPALGLGTWKSDPGEVKKAVYEAIKVGYRHIDCAEIYDNQKEVGEGIARALGEGICTREDLWITSKLWNTDHKKDRVVPALERMLKEMNLEYLDLFLIHWPVVLKEGVMFPKEPGDLLSLDEVPLTETWKGMVQCKEKGATRHIGVSNFNQDHLKTLIDVGPTPEMNQVELHPFLPQNDLLAFCKQNNIHITAYSPLGSADRSNRLKKEDEPVLYSSTAIKEVAEKHGASPFQVLIAWALKRGTAVIPKSTNPEHIASNFDALEIELDSDDMQKIAAMESEYRYVDGSFWAMEGSPYSMKDLW